MTLPAPTREAQTPRESGPHVFPRNTERAKQMNRTGKRMHEVFQGERTSLYELYESTPQSAGRTLTLDQCEELQALGIPWPISGDLSRTSPVRHRTLTLKHDSEEESEQLSDED